MKRMPETELMEEEEQVKAYAEADFAQPHGDFIERIKICLGRSGFSGHALDLGCGPGDISRRFAEAFPQCRVDAVDGALAMIERARTMTASPLLTRLQYIHGKLPGCELPEAGYGLIFSNSLLHHLPDPQILWQTIKRYALPGAPIFIMDLLRPNSVEQAREFIARYAVGEPDVLQHDFYHSLLAAFTPEEISRQLDEAELALKLEVISDRHVFIHSFIPSDHENTK